MTTLIQFLDRDVRPALSAALGLGLLLLLTDLALLAVLAAYVVIDKRYESNNLSEPICQQNF